MRYHLGIGIFCVLLATVGIMSADVVEVGNTVDGITYQGQYTFDENGVLNGAVLAGASNGVVDVDQYANENNGNVVAAQCGDIQGDAGFALTGAQDGSGSSGGTFASFTNGRMSFGQVSAGGEISSKFIPEGPIEVFDSTLSPIGTVSSSFQGVVAGQCVGIGGSSGYAATGVQNVNGASALSTAAFSEGGMIVGQVSGTGETSYLQNYGPQVSIPVLDRNIVFSGQIGGMQARSGSASTTGRTENGALARTDVSFTDGSICFGQLVDGESFTVSEGLGLGGIVPGVSIDEIESYQSVESERFSTIAASSYSQLLDGTYVQVNAAAAGSYLPVGISGQFASPRPEGSYFSTSQGTEAESEFISPYIRGLGVSAGSGSFQDLEAWEDVTISGVESGSASAGAMNSQASSASVLAYVNQGDLSADDIETGAHHENWIHLSRNQVGMDRSWDSHVDAGYEDISLSGTSGGILLDTQTPRNFAYIHTTFSDGGTMKSDEDEYGGDGGYVSANTEEDEYRLCAQSNSYIEGNPRVTTYFDTGITGLDAWLPPGFLPITDENIRNQQTMVELEEITGPGDAHSLRGSIGIVTYE